MASITLILSAIGTLLMILTATFPLVFMLFVNKKIEKRYNCKLNIDNENKMFSPMYYYYRYFNPGNTIAVAVLFNSQKIIDKNKCLKAINYNLKTAPIIEKIICTTCYLIGILAILTALTAFILMKIYDVN